MPVFGLAEITSASAAILQVFQSYVTFLITLLTMSVHMYLLTITIMYVCFKKRICWCIYDLYTLGGSVFNRRWLIVESTCKHCDNCQSIRLPHSTHSLCPTQMCLNLVVVWPLAGPVFKTLTVIFCNFTCTNIFFYHLTMPSYYFKSRF